jgi:hypothetical protein
MQDVGGERLPYKERANDLELLMNRIITFFLVLSVLLVGSVALAQSADRAERAEEAASRVTTPTTPTNQGKLTNNTNGNNQYTGSGSCDCSGGGNQPYSGCGNAGVDIWVGGVYDTTGSTMAKSCADAACAAAGAGSCNLAGLVVETTGGGELELHEVQEVQERVER